MRSANESYERPDESEEWANTQFSVVKVFMAGNRIPYAGNIFLTWLAAPYVSIWWATHTGAGEGKVWIMHNEFMTDYIIDRDIQNEREALEAFANRWCQAACNIDDGFIEEVPSTITDKWNDDARFSDKLSRHGVMLRNVSNDDEMWMK